MWDYYLLVQFYLLNSLAAFKLIDSKSVGYFNLFVGALQTLTPLYLLFTGSQSDEWTILS
ncbi:AmiS/UreI family transporter [Bacillus pacificus]